MASSFALIFYLGSIRTVGPAVVYFDTIEDCVRVGNELDRKFSGYKSSWTCVDLRKQD